MAQLINVNGAITDAVTQANVKVLGDSPAMSLSNLYQTVSQSSSLSVQNAVTMQQQSNIIQQTNTALALSSIYAVRTAVVGMATNEILKSDTLENLINAISKVIALRNNA